MTKKRNLQSDGLALASLMMRMVFKVGEHQEDFVVGDNN